MPIISATPITVRPVPIPTPTHHSPDFMSFPTDHSPYFVCTPTDFTRLLNDQLLVSKYIYKIGENSGTCIVVVVVVMVVVPSGRTFFSFELEIVVSRSDKVNHGSSQHNRVSYIKCSSLYQPTEPSTCMETRRRVQPLSHPPQDCE